MAMEKIRTLLETDLQTQQRRNEEQLLKSLSPEIKEKYIKSEYENPTSRRLMDAEREATAEQLLGPLMLGIPGVGGLPAKLYGPLAKGGQFVMNALRGNKALQSAAVLGGSAGTVAAIDRYNTEQSPAGQTPQVAGAVAPEVAAQTSPSPQASVPTFTPGRAPAEIPVQFDPNRKPQAAEQFLSALSGLERPTPTMPNTDRTGDLERQMQVAQDQKSRMTGSGYVEPKRGIAERIIGKVKPVTDFVFHNQYDPDAGYKREVARQMTEAQLKQMQSAMLPTEQVTASDAMAEADRKRQLENQVGMAEYARTGQMDPKQLELLSFLRGQAEREGGQQDAMQRMNEAERLSRESARMPNPTALRENTMARAPYLFNSDQLSKALETEIDPAMLQQLVDLELLPKTNPVMEMLQAMYANQMGAGGLPLNTGE